MRKISYRLCDVFTARPFTGNPLAVFSDAEGLDAETMQTLAREMNLSESTFVLPPTDPGADARIRIFTPRQELPFAGHPTLGSAFVLTDPLQGETTFRLETARCISTVRLSRDEAKNVFGWMTQPLPVIGTFDRIDELLAGLRVERSMSPVELYDNGPHHLMVELEAPAQVAGLRPDLSRLETLGSFAISTFARTERGWKTRVFAPGEGINEDPATGAAAGPLALHLARHGRTRFGDEVVIEQGAELGRPSRLHGRVQGSRERVEAIEVGGNAVLIGRGEIEIP